MSAFIVGKDHIDLLTSQIVGQSNLMFVRGGIVDGYSGPWTTLDDLDADRIGSILWAENLASIEARYPDTAETHSNYPGPNDFTREQVAAYRWRRTPPVTPAEVFKAIDCYQYQSCEHKGWDTSHAKWLTDALRAPIARQVPGYDEAPWEWTRPLRWHVCAKHGRSHCTECRSCDCYQEVGKP